MYFERDFICTRGLSYTNVLGTVTGKTTIISSQIAAPRHDMVVQSGDSMMGREIERDFNVCNQTPEEILESEIASGGPGQLSTFHTLLNNTHN